MTEPHDSVIWEREDGTRQIYAADWWGIFLVDLLGTNPEKTMPEPVSVFPRREMAERAAKKAVENPEPDIQGMFAVQVRPVRIAAMRWKVDPPAKPAPEIAGGKKG